MAAKGGGIVWAAAGLGELCERGTFLRLFCLLAGSSATGPDNLNVKRSGFLSSKSKFAARAHGPADCEKKSCQCGRAGVLSHKFPEASADVIFIIQGDPRNRTISSQSEIADDRKEYLKSEESCLSFASVCLAQHNRIWGPLQKLGNFPE
jgi:hypothetical protein